MATELAALLISDKLLAANLFLSAIAMTLGSFAAVAPNRAAKVWGSQQFANLAPARRSSFVRWYRVFGVFLFLGGLLFAVESIFFSGDPFK
jgi:hypothetical protein